MMMHSVGICRCCSSLRRVRPSSLGILRSASTTPYRSTVSLSSAFCPSATTSTPYPASSRIALSPVVIAASSSAMRIFACFIVSRRVAEGYAWASRPGENDRKFLRRFRPAHAGDAKHIRRVGGHQHWTIGLQSDDERIAIARELAHHRLAGLAAAARDRVEERRNERETQGVARHGCACIGDVCLQDGYA